MRPRREEEEIWTPVTKLGKAVEAGEITTMHDVLTSGLALREHQIVDKLLPKLEDEVLNVNMVQRMTDSGRRVRFGVVAVVGNMDGYVGLAMCKGKEVGPTIRKTINVAKLNLIEVKRGCGSWECGCGTPHSLPFKVTGRSGSVRVTFYPAPRGVGLAVGKRAMHILRLAGIHDAWGFTEGKTKTTVNYAKAAFNALLQTTKVKITEFQKKNLNIISGPASVISDLPIDEGAPPEVEEGGKESEPPKTVAPDKVKEKD